MAELDPSRLFRGEPLGVHLARPPGAHDPALGTRRLIRWGQVVGPDPQALDCHLDRLGFTRDQAAHRLGACDHSQAPAWAQLVLECLAAVHQGTVPEMVPALLPFEEAIRPLLRVAWQGVEHRLGWDAIRLDSLISPEVQETLLQALLYRLCGVSAQVLMVEFEVFRRLPAIPKDEAAWRAQTQPLREDALGINGPLWPFRSRDIPTDASRIFYPRFIRYLADIGFSRALGLFPAWARWLAILVEQFIEATAELLLALAADTTAIATTFFAGVPLGRVLWIKPSCSDPHHGLRQVVILGFSCGRRLVFKPRGLGLEQAWGELIARLNAQGSVSLPQAPKVLDRGVYGWMAFVSAQPCVDLTAVTTYYRRAGAILALTHVLRGTDFHSDNLVATGEGPVLVDVETLLCPRSPPQGPKARRVLEESVYSTRLLPHWLPGHGEVDLSGLGTATGGTTRQRRLGWVGMNCDHMALGWVEDEMAHPASCPMHDGRPHPIHNYQDDLILGFRETYDALMAHCPDLDTLLGQATRWVMRDTQIYGALLRRLSHPRYLMNGMDHGIELDIIFRATLTPGAQPALWTVAQAERQALEALTIPHFQTQPGSLGLNLEGYAVKPPGTPALFVETQAQTIRQRLQKMGAERREAEVQIIRSTLWASRAHHDLDTGVSLPLPVDREPMDHEPHEFLRGASAVAETLVSMAWHDPEGASWLGLHLDPTCGRYRLQSLGLDLYDGQLGIAFFLAALVRVTGGANSSHLDAALAPFRLLAQGTTPALARIGAQDGFGLGGLLYGLSWLAWWTGDAALRAACRTVAIRMTDPATWPAGYGLLGGLASWVHGLLAWHSLGGEAWSIDAAVRVGERVCAEVESAPPGPGFINGDLGVMHALLRLGRVYESEHFHETVEGLLLSQSRMVQDETQGLVGTMADGPRKACRYAYAMPTGSWCRGAVGRLALEIEQKADGRRGGKGYTTKSLLSILDQVRHDALTQAHGLCCGLAGKVDLLLTVANHIKSSTLRHEACCLGQALLDVAWDPSSFVGAPGLMGHHHAPGFFFGLAGLGYTLLRLGYPEILPSVLNFDVPLSHTPTVESDLSN